ncbi:putative Ig domain-containing protein [Blastococcus litoris]|uniref:putative Ig domain-containing protein n=1 Tax=Blastococcus litoris TaxID=2171622 RepID=UPI000E301CCC|nr:putative Ig domain-containing protein [Blastococcus litoris]
MDVASHPAPARHRTRRALALIVSVTALVAAAVLTSATGARAGDEIASTVSVSGTVGQPLSVQVPFPLVPDTGLSLDVGFGASFDGLTLEPDGLLHGTPTEPTQSCRTYRVIGESGYTGRLVEVCLDIAAPVVTGQPPAATVGVPYSFQILVARQSPSFSTSGLPDGLQLSADGLVSGTPTGPAGTYSVVFHVRYPDGSLESQFYYLEVLPPAGSLRVTGTPPPATLGQPYRFAFDTTGSDPAPTFHLESGALPDGLTLSPDGVISGTPTTIGEGSEVAVRASNGSGVDAGLQFTIPVDGVPITLTGTPLSPVAVGTEYDFSYTVAGAPHPTTSVTAGSLPDGLALSPDGRLTGFARTPGSYTFTVTATAGGVVADVATTSTIVVTAPVTLTGTPGQATVGRAYSFAFTAAGSPAPTVHSTGQLPDGLTLSPAGVLSGTPTRGGEFSFTVVAGNGLEQAALPVRLSVAALPEPTASPELSIGDASVTEGDRLARLETFRITLSAPATGRVTVRWVTANGTATALSDYVPVGGTVTFAPGQTTRTVAVPVLGDRRREATETYSVRLARPSGALIGDGTAVGTIVNDD